MRRFKLTLARWLAQAYRSILPPRPKPNLEPAVALLERELQKSKATERDHWEDYKERCCELIEARQMAGPGPWLNYEARAALADNPNLPQKELTKLREANPIVSQGAFGDVELALQNVEWRREINLSWMEFSRWGIQQIMLISRLYYIKNPILRRLIDIAACYVFGRGVEVACTDEDANDVLKDFFEANGKVLGQNGLVELERQKFYDGNLFFAFFPDTQDSGAVKVRMMEATEILDIISDPNDSDTPWYYRRQWIERNFNVQSGQVETVSREAWYPALGFEPADKPDQVGSNPVIWEVPILHRKVGKVAKWKFGCPIIYPALDWAKFARQFLESCANIKKALSQFAIQVTTKGGQQAIQSVKQQMETSVGPQAPIWDTNPPAVGGATFITGTGTAMQAFQQRGVSDDPEEVRQYKLMCCMVVGVPETFLADVSTGNLATATTLDRPTELVFLERQQEWQEDLVTIAKYVLTVSKAAPNGKLREALTRRGIVPAQVRIVEMAKQADHTGRMVYVPIAEAKRKGKKTELQVLATFPAIREGDMAINVKAIAEAMTLDNKGGQVVGIDEKAGVFLLMKQLGVQNAEELIEQMYPSDYDPDRTKEPLPAPIPKLQPAPAGTVPAPTGETQDEPAAVAKESLVATAHAIRELGVKLLNGHAKRTRRS